MSDFHMMNNRRYIIMEVRNVPLIPEAIAAMNQAILWKDQEWNLAEEAKGLCFEDEAVFRYTASELLQEKASAEQSERLEEWMMDDPLPDIVIIL